MILPPIAQVGWASACSTVTSRSSAALRPRNGPPEAVRISRSTVPGRSPASSWCSAECSESTGMIGAPVASASCVTSSPPTTSDSLLASARSMPSPSVATVGTSPAEPTIALSTRSQSHSVISSTSPSAPASTSRRSTPRRARAAASGSASAIRSHAVARCACSTSASQARPALSADDLELLRTARRITSSAWTPIEPVEPRMTTRRAIARDATPHGESSPSRRLRETRTDSQCTTATQT